MYKNVWCTCIVVLLIKVLSTRIRFHLKTRIFLYGYDFHPHVSDENDQWKRSFSKTLSRVELSENAVFTCTCGQAKTELTVNPLLSPTFQRRKVNKPPVSIKSPPSPYLPSVVFNSINVYWAVMVYSGWKFILFLVFDRISSNFMCWTFSALRSSSLWRIVAIFLLLEKAV